MLAATRIVLLVGGAAMVATGGIAVWLGLTSAGWLLSQLPSVVVDTPAVGGAAVALGVSVAGIGATQLLVGVALRHPRRWLIAVATVLAAVLAAAWVALAAAVATAAAGSGSIGLLVAGAALAAIAWAYGTAALRAGRAVA